MNKVGKDEQSLQDLFSIGGPATSARPIGLRVP